MHSADQNWQCDRIYGNRVQTIRVSGPLVASVTNDRNRLRHPLMKNVMLAKQQKIDVLSAANAPAEPAGLSAAPVRVIRIALEPLTSGRRTDAPCRMLPGTIDDQAQALADYLRDGRVTQGGVVTTQPMHSARCSQVMTNQRLISQRWRQPVRWPINQAQAHGP